MNIFENQINFNNWIEIFVGIENNFIKKTDVLFFYESGNLPFCTENDYVNLYIALNDKNKGFENQVKKLVENDFRIKLTLDPEKDNYALQLLDTNPYRIWELEYLLAIKKSCKPLEDKIYDIYLLWCDFKYFNVDWGDFLWLNNSIANKEKLYENFNSYIEFLTNNLK